MLLVWIRSRNRRMKLRLLVLLWLSVHCRRISLHLHLLLRITAKLANRLLLLHWRKSLSIMNHLLLHVLLTMLLLLLVKMRQLLWTPTLLNMTLRLELLVLLIL